MSESFSPSWPDDREDTGPSTLAVVELPMPMGMVIAESLTLADKIEVTEVREGSNAEKVRTFRYVQLCVCV